MTQEIKNEAHPVIRSGVFVRFYLLLKALPLVGETQRGPSGEIVVYNGCAFLGIDPNNRLWLELSPGQMDENVKESLGNIVAQGMVTTVVVREEGVGLLPNTLKPGLYCKEANNRGPIPRYIEARVETFTGIDATGQVKEAWRLIVSAPTGEEAKALFQDIRNGQITPEAALPEANPFTARRRVQQISMGYAAFNQV